MKKLGKVIMAFVLVAAIATALSSTAFAAGGFISDDFSSCAPPVPWTFLNTAVTGQTITETNNHLEIVAPAGTEQTIWVNAGVLTYNVPRAVQPFGGTGTEDFGVEVKFDSTVNQQFQQQGIVIEQNAGNALRFEFFFENTSGIVIYAARFNSNSSGVVSKQDLARVNGIATAPTALTMRVTRSAGVWSLEYKVDAGAYTPVTLNPQPPANFPISQLGVYAGTSGSGSTPALGHTASVDYFFNVDAPIANEDVCSGPPPTTTPEPAFNFSVHLPFMTK